MEERCFLTVAAYIDLNSVRARIVKAYRWSGYGEAMAGIRLRRAGLMGNAWGWEQMAF